MKNSKALCLLQEDLERIRGLVRDTGGTARELLGPAGSDPAAARRAVSRLVQFEDVALQLLQQAEGHLREAQGATASSRVVEQRSLEPGDIELF